MRKMALEIVHREPGTQLIPAGAPTWRTCLREISFSNGATSDRSPSESARRLSEGDAYRVLLEILCGLQSPMVGETQVLGQFKAFLATLGHDQAWLGRLGQRLLGDAREIRTKYLQGLGSRSYGSAVRRHLAACRHAVLIGTGKLAQEVLPFLADEGRPVDHWGRREDAASSTAGVTYRTLDQIDDAVVPDATVLIIAAPVPSDVVARVAARYTGLQSRDRSARGVHERPAARRRADRLAPGFVCADGRRERVRVAPRRSCPHGYRPPQPPVRVPRRAAPVRLGRPVRVRILSRASDLARLQAMLVSRALQAQFPELDIQLLTRASAGDRDGTTPLAAMPDKGAFTSDLSDALLKGHADLVVHSWKDLPLEDRDGTTVAATLERARSARRAARPP